MPRSKSSAWTRFMSAADFRAQVTIGTDAGTAAALAEAGYIPAEELKTYSHCGSRLQTHDGQAVVAGQALINLIPGATPAGFQNAVVDTPSRALRTNINGTNRNNNITRLDGAVNIYLWLPHHTVYVAPAETVETVRKHVGEGYRRIKLKIEPGTGVERVRAVREAFPAVVLTVDANAAYTLVDADHLQALDRFDLDYIEQPLHHEDLLAHAALAKRLKTPICLDESIRSAADFAAAVVLGACRVVNVKIGRVGGHGEALRIHEEAAKADPSSGTIQQNLENARRNREILGERDARIAEALKQAEAHGMPAKKRLIGISGWTGHHIRLLWFGLKGN